MADFTAKDVQSLRQETGAGMMDAKKALEETSGDAEAARKLLREKGLTKAGARSDRENTQGAVAIATAADRVAMVELKCETDFVAKSPEFVAAAQQLADAAAADGEAALSAKNDQVDELKVTLKENIEVGRSALITVEPNQVVDTYLHQQDGRGVNGVVVVLSGGSAELAHDVAVHAAFTKPAYLRREDVPAQAVEDEREALLSITKAEGKPEAAWPKIVEGRLNGWYKEHVLTEQPYVRDDKQTIAQLVEGGGAELVSFAQVFIGG